MSHMSHLISVEQAQAVVPDKKAFYSAMLRNQVVMPPYTDAIVTREFMQGVVDGRYWCLRSADITTFRVCAEPPNKKDLGEMLYFLMCSVQPNEESVQLSFRSTAELVRKNPPTISWQILVICTIDPNHEIFGKNYLRPRVISVKRPSVHMVPNTNGFFNGLPVARSKAKHKIQFVSKADRERDEIQRLREQMTDMQLRLEGKVQASSHRMNPVPSQQHSHEELKQHSEPLHRPF